MTVKTKISIWKSINLKCLTNVFLYWWICRYNSPYLYYNTIEKNHLIWSPWITTQFKFCVDVVLTWTQWPPVGLESGLKGLWNIIVMTLWLSFLAFYMKSLNVFYLQKFVVKVLRDFKAWIRWSFDRSKFLKLDSSRTLRLGIIILMNFS